MIDPMVPSTLRLFVLGQALLQHDLRAEPWPCFAALAATFAPADLCFTDLETAIRSPSAEPPKREGVFLHAAAPPVLDCLKDLSISLLATANNHIWDLGTGGITGTLDELDARGFTHAGAGSNLAEAGAPAYRPTANGIVALVAAASGAIREGAAATATRAGVNELPRKEWDFECRRRRPYLQCDLRGESAGRCRTGLSPQPPSRGGWPTNPAMAAAVRAAVHRCRRVALCQPRRAAAARDRALSLTADLLRPRQSDLSDGD